MPQNKWTYDTSIHFPILRKPIVGENKKHIFTTNISEYEDSYKTYFYSRKNWFFAFLGFSFLLDVIDTLIKGKAYFIHSGVEYDIRILTHIALCLLAIRISNKKFQAALVILFIVYEISYIARAYEFLGK